MKEITMDILKKAGKIADIALRGTTGYLESASKSVSQNKNYTEEQRYAFKEYSERMRDIKENGFQSLSSNDDYESNYCEDDYDDICYDKVDYSQEDDERNIYTNMSHKKNPDKCKSTSNVGRNSFEKRTYKEEKKTERERNGKIRASIKREKIFEMNIAKIQYVDKREKSGFVLSGWIEKGGIYQANQMQVIISHRNGIKSQHHLISISCKVDHKKYNYARKGQYVRLFIKGDKSFDMTMADSVCEVIYG